MIPCQNCGQLNAPAVRICRYCGSALQAAGGQTAPQPQVYAPPPPYAWATEQPPIQQRAPVQPYAAPGAAAGYRCPRCGTTYPPIVEKKVSSEGWLIFALLFLVCVPLCWIGLLMKQETRVCPMCHVGLG